MRAVQLQSAAVRLGHLSRVRPVAHDPRSDEQDVACANGGFLKCQRRLRFRAADSVAGRQPLDTAVTRNVDVREPVNPVTIATMPLPEEDDYCRQPGHFGPHSVHEMRPGSWQDSNAIFATLQNAGVRVYDIHNPFAPRQLAYFVPPFPESIVDPRPRPFGVNTTDVYVDPNGLMYVTDYNAGL